jgi:DNA-binding transcriptional LysR family regulator
MDRLACDRMFVAVLEAGSFAAAAARLRTSSGQASKLVSRLEAELGARLLNRTMRAVSPTEAGQAYFDRIRPLLDEFDSLDLSIRNIAQVPRGRLRLTAPLTFGTMELAPALNDFAKQYPQIELDVSFSDRVVGLVDEGFDMAVRIGRPADTSLIARKLCEVRVVLVGADSYFDRHGRPEGPADLAQHECIIDTNFREPGRWPFCSPAGDPLVVTVNGRMRYSNAAEAGIGLAYIPSFVAGPALAAARVRVTPTPFETEPFGVYALYPHSRHLAAKVRVLVDFLAERYRGKPHWEQGL